MANRTVKDARTVKGTNPQYLVEKIIRTRIYESKYWKEECFALSGMCQTMPTIVLLSVLPSVVLYDRASPKTGPARPGHAKIALYTTAVEFDQFSLYSTGTCGQV